MGYSTERFMQEDIDEEFICPICQDVLQDAKLTTNCQHTFCSTCIQNWVKTSPTDHCTCPSCRQPTGKLVVPQRGFMNLLGRLQLTCQYASRGCDDVVQLNVLREHEANCDFNPVNAKKPCFKGCGALLIKKEARQHDCLEFLTEKLSQLNLELRELDLKGVTTLSSVGINNADPEFLVGTDKLIAEVKHTRLVRQKLEELKETLGKKEVTLLKRANANHLKKLELYQKEKQLAEREKELGLKELELNDVRVQLDEQRQRLRQQKSAFYYRRRGQ